MTEVLGSSAHVPQRCPWLLGEGISRCSVDVSRRFCFGHERSSRELLADEAIQASVQWLLEKHELQEQDATMRRAAQEEINELRVRLHETHEKLALCHAQAMLIHICLGPRSPGPRLASPLKDVLGTSPGLTPFWHDECTLTRREPRPTAFNITRPPDSVYLAKVLYGWRASMTRQVQDHQLASFRPDSTATGKVALPGLRCRKRAPPVLLLNAWYDCASHLRKLTCFNAWRSMLPPILGTVLPSPESTVFSPHILEGVSPICAELLSPKRLQSPTPKFGDVPGKKLERADSLSPRLADVFGRQFESCLFASAGAEGPASMRNADPPAALLQQLNELSNQTVTPQLQQQHSEQHHVHHPYFEWRNVNQQQKEPLELQELQQQQQQRLQKQQHEPQLASNVVACARRLDWDPQQCGPVLALPVRVTAAQLASEGPLQTACVQSKGRPPCPSHVFQNFLCKSFLLVMAGWFRVWRTTVRCQRHRRQCKEVASLVAEIVCPVFGAGSKWGSCFPQASCNISRCEWRRCAQQAVEARLRMGLRLLLMACVQIWSARACARQRTENASKAAVELALAEFRQRQRKWNNTVIDRVSFFVGLQVRCRLVRLLFQAWCHAAAMVSTRRKQTQVNAACERVLNASRMSARMMVAFSDWRCAVIGQEAVLHVARRSEELRSMRLRGAAVCATVAERSANGAVVRMAFGKWFGAFLGDKAKLHETARQRDLRAAVARVVSIMAAGQPSLARFSATCCLRFWKTLLNRHARDLRLVSSRSDVQRPMVCILFWYCWVTRTRSRLRRRSLAAVSHGRAALLRLHQRLAALFSAWHIIMLSDENACLRKCLGVAKASFVALAATTQRSRAVQQQVSNNVRLARCFQSWQRCSNRKQSRGEAASRGTAQSFKSIVVCNSPVAHSSGEVAR